MKQIDNQQLQNKLLAAGAYGSMLGPRYTFKAETEEEEYLLLKPGRAAALDNLLDTLIKHHITMGTNVPEKYRLALAANLKKRKEVIDERYRGYTKEITDKYQKIRDDQKAKELAEKKALEAKEKIKEAVREVLDEREKDADAKSDYDGDGDISFHTSWCRLDTDHKGLCK